MLTKDEVREIIHETLQEMEDEEDDVVEFEWNGAIELMKDCLIVLFFVSCAIVYAAINYTSLPLGFITDKESISTGLSVAMVVSGLTFLNRRYGWL